MNCSDAQDRLSAYYDGELSDEERRAVAQHLAECERCASEIAGFESLSRAIGGSALDEVPPAIWTGIEAKLTHDSANAPIPLATNPPRPWASMRRLALAASILLLLGSGLWTLQYLRDARLENEHSAEFVATMDRYLRTLSTDPAVAEQILLSQYEGRPVDAENAVQLVGYHPAVLEGLPNQYTLVSTDVLKMPCCTCVKATCKRNDGSTLVLFEHDDEKTEWFGKRPINMAMCGDRECCLVDLDSSLAATWKRGSRSLTVVGARDVNEVNLLVNWLDENVRTTL